MGEIVKFNKDALIEELKQIHKDMVSVYKELFTYKYENNEDFRNFIEKEYRENGIANDDKEKWNDNFCHRTSYTLINKVLFIRICEDKGFMFNPNEDFIMGEPKDPNIGKKLSARGRDRWISLISNYTFGELLKFAFADMKESFKNIALFKEDKYEKLNPTKQELELKFMLDSKEYKKTPIYSYEENVAKIIEKLDTSKFDFNVPAEGNILGDVYEKFMDRETRKAIGQFYTPDFVIEYILNNTVAEADVVENPFVSVLDPACGSGHFLIMAYDILKKKFEENIDRLREKYADVDYVYKNENMKGKEYWVKDRIHYHILKHCIFGADIDSFAVQLTTINLLLKDLDNFTDELNIMECDSLIKWEEDYDWQDLKQQLENISMFYTINYKDINGIHRHDTLSRDKAEELVRLCEFWDRKFDYLVGNPPWISLSGKHMQDINQSKTIYYTRKYDGNSYMPNIYEFFIRRGLGLIKNNGLFSFIVPDRFAENNQFIDLRKIILDNFMIKKLVFEVDFPDIITDTMIFILNRRSVADYLIETGTINNRQSIEKKEVLKTEGYKFKYYSNDIEKELIRKIKMHCLPLGKICSTTSGFGGKSNLITRNRVNMNQIEVLKGENIERYIVKDNFYFEFKKENITGRTTDEYKLGFSPKILVRKTGDTIIACYDDSGIFPEQSLYFIFELDEKFEYYYILAILNSKVINYYYINELVTNKNSTPQLKKQDLDEIPIKNIDKNKQKIFSRYVESIINIKREIFNWDFNLEVSNSSQLLYNFSLYNDKVKELHILEEELDNEIYALYELSEKQISIINKTFGIEKEEFVSLMKEVKSEEIVNRLSNHDYNAVAKYYKTKASNIIKVEEHYYEVNNNRGNKHIVNYDKLSNVINRHITNCTIKVLKNKNKYMLIDEIRDCLKNKYDNFEELMNIMRKDNPTKKSKDIVKEALNQFADTWNSYIKKTNAGKEPKELVKYYDNNYYGLSEWDDEIHKEYFIDAIKEYTEINPNEKKARDILKLFEGLNIKDKEDYIEIFNSQIKKAFRK